MDFISHTVEGSTDVQLLREHLINAKNLAEDYGTDIDIPKVTGLAALLHDLGKYRVAFQEYIQNGVGHHGSVDHSSFGAYFIHQFINEHSQAESEKDRLYLTWFGETIENAIMSHHNSLGLKDFVDAHVNSPFLKRLNKVEEDPELKDELQRVIQRFFQEVMGEKEISDYFDQAYKEFSLLIDKCFSQDKKTLLSNLFFIETYVYSCVLDADRTDTATFSLGQPVKRYDYSTVFEDYYQKLNRQLAGMNSEKEINQLRSAMSDECDYFAEKRDGIYQLSIPTGGGKTLAGMRYGLKRSILSHKKHIFGVLPFITIIEQNARVYRKTFNGDPLDNQNILEFHSNVAQELRSNKEKDDLLDLAEDSWNSPITVTTMVQFLNCIFASGTTNRRRFHNLCNSVIILDEVQKVPVKCLSLFNKAINFLKEVGHCSILLCTATQPALGNLKVSLKIDGEIIQDLSQRQEDFKRVRFTDLTRQGIQEHPISSQELAELITYKFNDSQRILVILNTIGAVNQLAENLDSGQLNCKVYALTTRMCAAHRQKLIKEIKDRLAQKLPTICVSTPLIEAGVDISFETVYRSVCGLDSIVQAAGRCNRNGERDHGDVYLVLLNKDSEKLDKLREIKWGQKIVLNMLAQKDFDPDSLLQTKVINNYFDHFYQEIDQSELSGYPTSDEGRDIHLADYIEGKQASRDYLQQNSGSELKAFSGSETIAKHFEVIDQETVSVLVPYGKGSDFIALLNSQNYQDSLSEIFKEAQPYLVNVFKNMLRGLIEKEVVYPIEFPFSDREVYAVRDSYYQEESGLNYQIKNSESMIF